MYVIERGIPLPPANNDSSKTGGGHPKSVVSLHVERLEIGESFLIGEYSAYLTAQRYSRFLRPKRFAFRKQSGGWRVWRTE